MRIGILHDFVQGECPGGADLTLKRLYETAPKNIELYWLRVGNLIPIFNLDNYIVANTRSVSNVQLEHLLEGKQYIKIHFDYRRVSPKIIWDAKLLVYMSPKQKLDMLGSGSAHVMPSLVDIRKFYPNNKSKKGYIWLGNYSRQKGIRNLFEYAEANQITIDCYGHGTPRVYMEQSKYCCIKVPISYEEVPKLIRQYRTLVHLPRGFEAGSRVFIEGVLSGLKIITNELEGDLSYEQPYNEERWRKRLKNAPQEFWQSVLQALR